VTDDAPWSMRNALPPVLHPQGTIVSGLHIGYIDTDMTVGVKGPKRGQFEPVASVPDRIRDNPHE
jgi:hypothetical protein